MYYSLNRVPVPAQVLGEFVAPNPWSGAAREKWTLKLYVLISVTFAAATRARLLKREQKQTDDQATRRRRVQDGKLGAGQIIGFESADGQVHMLPRVLLELWMAREVADDALPRLLQELEPSLKKSDFPLYRPRLLFKVEAILLLVFGLIALALVLADKTLDTGHRQTQTEQDAWLAQPMREQTVWAQGPGVPSVGCFRLRPGVVQPPPGLNTYGAPGLVCGFKAGNETRLALVDIREAESRKAAPTTAIVLNGVVLPPGKLGLPPQLMDALGEKFPQLDKSFLFVCNADWGNSGGFTLGPATPYVAWAGVVLVLPFGLYLFAATRWRRRDAALKERFRRALTHPGSGTAFATADAPALTR